MSITLADALINITGDDSPLGGIFSRVRSSTNTLVTGIGLGIGNAIVSGVGRVVGAVGELAGEMINGNAQFEQYNTQFEVLLGSADAAEERMADLAEFGAKTPFELSQVVEADRILQGFGLHAAEAAERFGFSGEQIRTIAGDVASGTGSSFQEMALLIGKFSAGATGEAISRMSELGITSRAELAEMGLEFSKSGELLTPLPEAMETVLGLMEDKYGGLMDAQSGTFNGMLSNLQDWKNATLRRLGEPIFELLKDKLGSTLEFLNDPATMAAIDNFATGLAAGIGSAVEWFNTVGLPALQTFFGWLTTQGIPQFQAFVQPIIDQILPALSQLGEWFNGVLPQVMGAVTQFVSWKDILIVLGGVLASFIIPAVASLVAGILAVAAPLVAAIAIVALLRKAWETDFGGIRDFVGGIWTAIQQAWEAFKLLFAGDWQGFLTAIGTAWDTAWNAVVTFLGNLWTMVQPKLTEWWNALVIWFQTTDWAGLAQTALNFLITKLGEFWALAEPTLQSWWDSIKSWFTDQDWKQLGFDVVTWILESLSTFVSEVIPTLVSWWDSIKSWFTDQDWGSLGDSVIDGIVNAIVAGAGAIASAVGKAASGAWEAWQSYWDSNSPSERAAGGADDVMAGFGLGFDRNQEGLIQQALGIGKNVESNLVKGMEGAVNLLRGGLAATPLMAGAGPSYTYTSQDTYTMPVNSKENAHLVSALIAKNQRDKVRGFMNR